MNKDPENAIVIDEEYVLYDPKIRDVAIGLAISSILLLFPSIIIFSNLNPYPNNLIGSILIIISFIMGIVSVCLFEKYYDRNNN
jgi:hypothetical protein